MDLSFSLSMPIGAWHPFLPAALASLLAQDADLNIAFLDASGDPRVKALADAHDARLAYRRHGPDGGQSAAILEGWANAPGAILGWLNADDILMPGALGAAAVRFRAEPGLDAVYGHSVILDEAGRMTDYHWAVEPPGPGGDFSRILEAGVVSQPSCFFRRDAYERAGGLDEALHYTMDWDLWIRLHKSGAAFGFIDSPLSQVLWGGGTKTAAFNARRRAELRRIIETYAPAEKRKKIFRAFALHHLMNRIEPPPLRKVVARALQRGRRVIYGLGADGRLENPAHLHLAHFAPSAKTGLLIEVEGDVRRLSIDAAAPVAERVDSKGAATLRFAAPAPAGRLLTVRLEAPPGETMIFRRAAWI